MQILDIIKKKRDGNELTAAELQFFVTEYTKGQIPDYQASALLMAIYLRGMTAKETSILADSMLHSGDVLDLSLIPGIKVDKHSTGGVGDKISIPLAPLVAAAGVKNPMISGRGLGHTGGTLDKLEAIPGFNVNLTEDDFIDQVSAIGTAIISATQDVAPADKKIYALRDTTGTVDSIPLIASSIMSKKLASGTNALVLDVKTGSGAFMQDFDDARSLAKQLLDIGQAHQTKMVALITNMNQPLGVKVGNTLEVEESIDILKGQGPEDTTKLTIELGAYMLVLAEQAKDIQTARTILQEKIADGSALAKFKELVEAEGGDVRVVDNYQLMPHAKNQIVVTALDDGYVNAIDTNDLGMLVVYLGGGRLKKTDKIDPGVGLVIHKKVGDYVHRGEPLVTVHANSFDDDQVQSSIHQAYHLSAVQPPAEELIYEIMEE
ncbi:pyrimidine-nucleoside phosphorylase [Amylolactobacillus amylotrophicus DSM 20534]|uniref:Thymidine phosphorylase n=3 Tax=Amylolactobacillus TaxID=2767876 RepID=A0A1L6XBJ6_9LACO|nr:MULTISPECIES: thymidine phosphorylase [Amylolactobacillus]APT18337.1 thymidine phosphorylase [Amylolactobacillus amylophilus DSM 20533 = JCM 1125]KRK38123.1 pyrimidine-nucleoside phosphorylase [Amylolactobacillus amylotrophicus DSM 20534]KRM43242.1 pyrimidine-nucleoside phosphorylase [Amylolactobacillus amylophilus DSM 20533 = JCM 1125]GED80902.1 thymidine phosphorylase [Amylolactobacillus amylophilus]